MSSHFNYEIDERNLRARLKGMSLPYQEEAWSQFEEYSESHQLSGKHSISMMPSIKFNVNRTLILPFVFGGVIILFSFLLFNFISIKKKPEAKTAIAEKPVKPEPQIHKEVALISNPEPVKKDTVSVKTETSTAIAEPTTSAIAAKTVAEVPVITPSPAVASNQVTNSANAWISNVSGKIYESPNIAANVVSNSESNKTYTAVEETVYFIKVNLGQGQTGYIMKSQLRRPGSLTAGSSNRNKNKKAEILESNQTPFMVSGSTEEKEPELK